MSLHQVGTHLCKQTLTLPQMQASGPLQQSEEDREKGTQAGRGRERQMESKYMTKKNPL